MDVRLHSRNTDLEDGFRRVATDKVTHAGRVFDNVALVDVELAEETNPRRADDRFRVELTTNAGGRVVRVEAASSTPEAALDEAVDVFTRQLRRLKEKLIDSHRRSDGGPPATGPQAAPGDEAEVVRTKQFVMKPLSVDEAALQMELLGHDFFFFHNAATDKQSVLYRRNDGRLGLIEPA